MGFGNFNIFNKAPTPPVERAWTRRELHAFNSMAALLAQHYADEHGANYKDLKRRDRLELEWVNTYMPDFQILRDELLHTNPGLVEEWLSSPGQKSAEIEKLFKERIYGQKRAEELLRHVA